MARQTLGRWWTHGVAYQIYVRSFFDENGDGIGDLRGVIAKLDYLVALGVTILWLTPFNPSPDNDNGYDISDYYGVDPRYGVIADVDVLIEECHQRDIRVIFDMVLNHTSDQHPWFVESRQSCDANRRDYYIWREGQNGREPNNWSAGFSPSAWEKDALTEEYYLHYYSAAMPDLDWDNPAMRDDLFVMMRWWMARGVDGFRLDSINLIKKNKAFPDAMTPDPAAPGYFYDVEQIYNQPGLIPLLQEIRRQICAADDFLLIGETSVTSATEALEFVRPESAALDLVFNFEPVELETADLVQMKAIQRRWYFVVEQGGWTTQYLSNHDQPRQVSKFGNDGPWRVRSAKALAVMIHTLPGTPFIYQGEEIGMINAPRAAIADYQDIASHNLYRNLMAGGASPAHALSRVQAISRDNARTPIPWDDSEDAGCGSANPWMALAPGHREINVAAARRDPDSVWHCYRHLIALRKAHDVIVHGDFEDVLPDDPRLYVYRRRLGDVSMLVAINLSNEAAEAAIDGGFDSAWTLTTLGPPTLVGDTLRLRPWEAVLQIH